MSYTSSCDMPMISAIPYTLNHQSFNMSENCLLSSFYKYFSIIIMFSLNSFLDYHTMVFNINFNIQLKMFSQTLVILLVWLLTIDSLLLYFYVYRSKLAKLLAPKCALIGPRVVPQTYN